MAEEEQRQGEQMSPVDHVEEEHAETSERWSRTSGCLRNRSDLHEPCGTIEIETETVSQCGTAGTGPVHLVDWVQIYHWHQEMQTKTFRANYTYYGVATDPGESKLPVLEPRTSLLLAAFNLFSNPSRTSQLTLSHPTAPLKLQIFSVKPPFFPIGVRPTVERHFLNLTHSCSLSSPFVVCFRQAFLLCSWSLSDVFVNLPSRSPPSILPHLESSISSD
ncbi:hypothetical protein ACOSQ2_014101 [Xanthoceras sorbifolium]